MEALAKKLQGKVQFVFVYGQEHHPNQELDGFPGSDLKVKIPALTATRNRAERVQRAREFCRLMKGSVRRFLIDEDEDGGEDPGKVQCLYKAQLAARIVVIDRNRHIRTVAEILDLQNQLVELFPELVADLLLSNGRGSDRSRVR